MSTPSSDTAAIRQIIRALRAAGYELIEVNDGDDEDIKVSTETEAIEAITTVDCAHLYVTVPTDSDERGCIFFVLGNDPEEVACDYTVNLSPVLDPIIDGWIS